MTSQLSTNSRGESRTSIALAGALLVAITTGCATFAGDRLADISPTAPTNPPVIEQTVGDFSFHLDGGKMVSSVKAGRTINDQILSVWKNSGFIYQETYVKTGKFSGNADYNLTLEGHQEGDSSITMQVISGLTLFLVPYWVHQQHDLRYVLEHVETGKRFECEASDQFTTAIGLLLAPFSPFLMGGAQRTYERLANHLYEGLASQDAFEPARWSSQVPGRLQGDADASFPPRPDSEVGATREFNQDHPVEERLKLLEHLRKENLISEEEYKLKRGETLDGL